MVSVTRRMAGALLVAPGLASPRILRAQSLRPLSLIVFPGGFNLPVWAAEQQGFFHDAGLQVTVTPTPNSVFQLTGLIEGRFDIGLTAIDNVVAYQEGQGEAQTNVPSDLRVFMGSDNGFLSLVTLPEIRSFAELRGQTLAVDALTTGYAFVLLEMLRRNNLWPEGVRIERFGGVANRWTTLQRREHAGTLLVTPFEILATDAGFNRLVRAPEVIGRYQGLVGAARRGWLAENRAQAVGFTQAYMRGLDCLYRAENRDAAVALLHANVPNMGEPLARQSVATLLDPTYGFDRRAAIDIPGVRTALELRTRYGRGNLVLEDPMRYIDLSIHEEASRRAG
jgi:ABC-type nitrate/sulfonate/bicarbonate transport system substrate-binding protein